MAAQIIHEPAVFGQRVELVDLVLEQAHVAAGERAPQVNHDGDVVQHVALGGLGRAEVGGELLGGHDHLALKHHGRADAFQNDAQHAHDGVDLRQVAAIGAKLLPDVRHGVDAEHLDTEVGQAHAAHHGYEHLRVAVVEVPLERVELGHHPLVHLLIPGEVAGRGVREDLRHIPVVPVGDGAVRVAEVIVLILGIAGFGCLGPAVGGGGVVHHEVDAQTDAGAAQLLGQRGEVFVGAELRVHGIEVLDRIATVVVRVRHVKQRHQVQVGELLLLQVRNLVGKFLEVAGEQVGVHGHAEHIAALVPARVLLAGFVETLQIGGTVSVGCGHACDECVEGVVIVI